MANEGLTPYVGPRPFEASERRTFFGRSKEISQIIGHIYSNQVLLLYSPAGAGKTSLLRAGVIPALSEDGFQIMFGRVAGGSGPFVQSDIQNIFIYNYLLSVLEHRADPTTLASTTLIDYLKDFQRPQDQAGQKLPLLLVFDQFEELFSRHNERWLNRRDFFDQISEALERDHLLRIVLPMKEEFIGDIEPFLHVFPHGSLARFRVEPLRPPEALRAISAPLTATGQRFDVGVAEKIVTNLSEIRVEGVQGETVVVWGEFIDPLALQVVMQTLWERLPTDAAVITQDHVTQFGNLDFALSTYYDDIVTSVTAQSPSISEEMLRRWFEDSLVTPMGLRGLVMRGRKETAGMPNEVLDQIEKQQLIRVQLTRGSVWYELRHDRFIRPIEESNRRFYSKQ